MFWSLTIFFVSTSKSRLERHREVPSDKTKLEILEAIWAKQTHPAAAAAAARGRQSFGLGTIEEDQPPVLIDESLVLYDSDSSASSSSGSSSSSGMGIKGRVSPSGSLDSLLDEVRREEAEKDRRHRGEYFGDSMEILGDSREIIGDSAEIIGDSAEIMGGSAGISGDPGVSGDVGRRSRYGREMQHLGNGDEEEQRKLDCCAVSLLSESGIGLGGNVRLAEDTVAQDEEDDGYGSRNINTGDLGWSIDISETSAVLDDHDHDDAHADSSFGSGAVVGGTGDACIESMEPLVVQVVDDGETDAVVGQVGKADTGVVGARLQNSGYEGQHKQDNVVEEEVEEMVVKSYVEVAGIFDVPDVGEGVDRECSERGLQGDGGGIAGVSPSREIADTPADVSISGVSAVPAWGDEVSVIETQASSLSMTTKGDRDVDAGEDCVEGQEESDVAREEDTAGQVLDEIIAAAGEGSGFVHDSRLAANDDDLVGTADSSPPRPVARMLTFSPTREPDATESARSDGFGQRERLHIQEIYDQRESSPSSNVDWAQGSGTAGGGFTDSKHDREMAEMHEGRLGREERAVGDVDDVNDSVLMISTSEKQGLGVSRVSNGEDRNDFESLGVDDDDDDDGDNGDNRHNGDGSQGVDEEVRDATSSPTESLKENEALASLDGNGSIVDGEGVDAQEPRASRDWVARDTGVVAVPSKAVAFGVRKGERVGTVSQTTPVTPDND